MLNKGRKVWNKVIEILFFFRLGVHAQSRESKHKRKTLVRQMIQVPALKPFSGSRDFMLVRHMVYVLGQPDISISVPNGFVTDFSSVQKGFGRLAFPRTASLVMQRLFILGSRLHQTTTKYDYVDYNKGKSGRDSRPV